MHLIDVDALKEKEQYIPCRNSVLFHGVTAASIDNQPIIDPETLPIVQELRAEIERLTTDGKQDLWAVERKWREEAEAKLERVTAERNRAVRAVERLIKEDANPCVFCAKCGVKCSGMNPDFCDNFEWRGLVAENATTESEV